MYAPVPPKPIIPILCDFNLSDMILITALLELVSRYLKTDSSSSVLITLNVFAVTLWSNDFAVS